MLKKLTDNLWERERSPCIHIVGLCSFRHINKLRKCGSVVLLTCKWAILKPFPLILLTGMCSWQNTDWNLKTEMQLL